jgi:glycolate oxidase FAD binding subunit
VLRPDQILVPGATKYRLPNELILPVVFPETLAEISTIVRLAVKRGWAMIVVGQGSKLHLGNVPCQADLMLATTRLPLLIEHEAADLTAKVSAGCQLRDCQAQFALAGQFLPVVPMQADVATIGGLIATNSQSQLRLVYGGIRDWLIGIKVINSQGELVKAGGQVVKNVAGYDLMKLYTGSLGTLGIIVEVNIKLRPKPVTETTWLAGFATFSQAWQAAQACLASQITPLALDVLNYSAVCQQLTTYDNMPYYLIGRYAGRSETIQAQLQNTQQLTKIEGQVLDAPASAATWSRLTTFGETALVQLRVSLRPQYLPVLMDYLENNLPIPMAIWGQMGTGVVQISILADSADNEIKFPITANDIAQLRTYLRRFAGVLVVERAPKLLRQQLDVWGDPQAKDLMQVIKQALDPNGIFSPGRFIAGI